MKCFTCVIEKNNNDNIPTISFNIVESKNLKFLPKNAQFRGINCDQYSFNVDYYNNSNNKLLSLRKKHHNNFLISSSQINYGKFIQYYKRYEKNNNFEGISIDKTFFL
jgi:fatty acid-binding protein DegV